jgi:serine protease Do
MKSRAIQTGFFAVACTMATVQTQAAPVDFSNLVEQVSPAVVSVNVVKKMTQEELLQQQIPEILKRFLVIKSLFRSSKRRKKKRLMAAHFLLVKMGIY